MSSTDLELRNIKMVLQYDGTCYNGWQYQNDLPTIQRSVESVLERVLGSPHRIISAGRTDAGVHAKGQVASFKTYNKIDILRLKSALNALLPNDISVKDLILVSDQFHPRKSSHRKLYTYTILNSSSRDPFSYKYSWLLRGFLDIEKMAYCLKSLEGVNDFTSFCAADTDVENKVRCIYQSELVINLDTIHINIEGNGFLKQMVRNIVGTIVEVGFNKRSVESFTKILDLRDRRAAGKTAPSRGLSLEWVKYDEDFCLKH